MSRTLGNLLLLAVLSVISSVEAMSEELVKGDAEAGSRVYSRCKVCHQIGPNARGGWGNVLNGIVGRKAAQDPDFPGYSPAMKASGLTWTAENLRQYLADPNGFLPGTRMVSPGLKNPKDIDDVIAYLAQFGADGSRK